MVTQILMVLGLSFLIGLEREESKGGGEKTYFFGGVRTYPLLGLFGYACALLSNEHAALLPVGLGAVGVLMFLSFHHKLNTNSHAGLTSEVSGLITFLLGPVVFHDHFWIAAALAVIGVLLLELKISLEGLARRIPSDDILTFTKFLLLSAVILPVLPDADMTQFQINPQRAWLVVVAISAISYGSYLLQRFLGDRGEALSAVLGGAYSSTAATVALAKRSKGRQHPRLYSGAILIASGTMYLRLALLVCIFSAALRVALAPILAVVGVIALGGGFYWASRAGVKHAESGEGKVSRNPLELGPALFFSVIFVAMMALTHFVLEHVGTSGVYGLSVVTGVTDVDPFILSLTQQAGQSAPILAASVAILIAAASNNLIKGVYAWVISDHETGRMSFVLLALLAALGLLPLPFLLAMQ